MMISPSGSPNSCCSECLGLPRHGDQLLGRALLQQQRRGLVPAERSPSHAAALVPDHRVEPQPHLVGALGCDQQHAALALDGVAEERLAGPERGRQIKHDERLAGAPLAREQPVPDSRDQVLDQPALSGRGSGSPCAYSGGRFGSGCGGSSSSSSIEIVVELQSSGSFVRLRRRRASGSSRGSSSGRSGNSGSMLTVAASLSSGSVCRTAVSGASTSISGAFQPSSSGSAGR